MYLIFLWSMLLTNWKTIPIVVFKISHFPFHTQNSSICYTLKSIWNACSNWRVVPLYFHCMYMHECMHYSRAFLFFNLSIFCLNNTLILHFSGCYIMQLCNTDVIAEYNTMKLLSYRYQTKLFIQRGTNMFWKNYASQLRNTCTCNI